MGMPLPAACQAAFLATATELNNFLKRIWKNFLYLAATILGACFGCRLLFLKRIWKNFLDLAATILGACFGCRLLLSTDKSCPSAV